MLHAGVLPAAGAPRRPSRKPKVALGPLAARGESLAPWNCRRAFRWRQLLRALAQSARVIGRGEKQYDGRRSTLARRTRALFVALHGEHTDGHRFIGDAVRAAAHRAYRRNSVRRIRRRNGDLRAGFGARTLAAGRRVLRRPRQRELRVAGVTGTNGKTTTTQMIGGDPHAAACRAGTIGTIGARFGRRDWPLANTTPLAAELQRIAREDARPRRAARRDGSEFARACARCRVADVRFSVAGAHEHDARSPGFPRKTRGVRCGQTPAVRYGATHAHSTPKTNMENAGLASCAIASAC